MRITITAFLVAAFAANPLATASAAPVTVPTGLNSGDQYRLAFVTSTTRDATSSNIADYNAFVTTVANSIPELVALGTTWTAIASTDTVDARDNTATNQFTDGAGVPIYTLIDTLIASGNGGLWGGTLQHPICAMQTGAIVPSDAFPVWTGTRPDGTTYGTMNIALGSPSHFSVIGSSTDTDVKWIDRTSQTIAFNQGNQTSLYAISDVLTVVPEPDAMALACLAAAGLGLPLRRRQRQRRLQG